MASDLPRVVFRGRVIQLLALTRAYARLPTARNRIIRLVEMVATVVEMARDREDGWLFLGEGPRYILWLKEYPRAAQCLCASLMVIRDIVIQTDARKQSLRKRIVAEAKRLGLPRVIRECAELPA